MHVELAPHSQLGSACRATCPARGNCRDCPIARLCVRFLDDAPVLVLAEEAQAADPVRPVIRVENLTAPDRAA